MDGIGINIGFTNAGPPPAFTPSDLSPYFWIEARNGMVSGGGDPTDGDDLDSITDLSTNGRDLEQLTSGNRPEAYPDGDGLGYAHFRTFDTGEKHMDMDFASSFAGMRIFMVFRLTGTPANGGRILTVGSLTSDTNAQSYIPLFVSGSDLVAYASGGQLIHQGVAAAGTFLLECVVEDGNQESTLNRGTTLSGSVSLPLLDFERLSVGSGHHSSSNGVDMNVEMLFGMQVSISPEDRTSLLDYILAEFGV